MTTAKRLRLPKTGGRAAGCSPPFKNSSSGFKSLDENWELTSFFFSFFFEIQSTQCLGGGWSCKDLTSTVSQRHFLLYRTKSFLLSLKQHLLYMHIYIIDVHKCIHFRTIAACWAKIRFVAQAVLRPILIRCHWYFAFHKREHSG